MDLPYGKIEDKTLEMRFSSADFTVASVLAALREHLDMLREMGAIFLGVATDVPAGPQPVFRPVDVKAIFEFTGSGDAAKALRRAYEVVWQGIVATFPAEPEWATAKEGYAHYISSQAELLRARVESTRE